MPKSSDQIPFSVLADSSFLTQPSNAQILQKQQLDATAAQSFQKYLLIGGVLVLGGLLILKLRK